LKKYIEKKIENRQNNNFIVNVDIFCLYKPAFFDSVKFDHDRVRYIILSLCGLGIDIAYIPA
jgi:hypothetical protein